MSNVQLPTCSQWVMSRTLSFKHRDINAVQASRGRWAWQLMCRCCNDNGQDGRDDNGDNGGYIEPGGVETKAVMQGSRGSHLSPAQNR